MRCRCGSPSRSISPICCCWSRAAIASSSPCAAPGDFTRLGTTIDDAVGECFDKTAKLLGLGFPGGPAVERMAKEGDAQRFALPRPMWRKPGCDFSFSGLKTAVRQAVEKLDPADSRAIADLCASFQRTVGDVLADRCANALAAAPSPTLVVAGGVAANLYLRGRLQAVAARAWCRSGRAAGQASAPTMAP